MDGDWRETRAANWLAARAREKHKRQIKDEQGGIKQEGDGGRRMTDSSGGSCSQTVDLDGWDSRVSSANKEFKKVSPLPTQKVCLLAIDGESNRLGHSHSEGL